MLLSKRTVAVRRRLRRMILCALGDSPLSMGKYLANFCETNSRQAPRVRRSLPPHRRRMIFYLWRWFVRCCGAEANACRTSSTFGPDSMQSQIAFGVLSFAEDNSNASSNEEKSTLNRCVCLFEASLARRLDTVLSPLLGGNSARRPRVSASRNDKAGGAGVVRRVERSRGRTGASVGLMRAIIPCSPLKNPVPSGFGVVD